MVKLYKICILLQEGGCDLSKAEFLTELENALEDKLPKTDLDQVLSDYSSFFNEKTARGRTEESASKQLGSPAKIARNIIDTRNLAETVGLASMSRRLGAFMVDTFVSAISILLAVLPSKLLGSGTIQGGILILLLPLILLLGVSNILTAILLWAGNGYTPGKWLLKIRVVKLDSKKLTFWDAILREFLIKGIGNVILNGILNIGSFIWGCATSQHKTVQDLAAQTKVIKVAR